MIDHETRARALFRIQPDAQLGRGGIVVYFCEQIIATCVDQETAEQHVEKMVPFVSQAFAAYGRAVERDVWEEAAAQAYECYRQSIVPKIGDWRPPQPFEEWCRAEGA